MKFLLLFLPIWLPTIYNTTDVCMISIKREWGRVRALFLPIWLPTIYNTTDVCMISIKRGGGRAFWH